VGDAGQRLSLYKRFYSSASTGDLAHLHGEFLDRYGPVPPPVEQLFEVMEIRLLAKILHVADIQVSGEAATFTLDKKSVPAQTAVQALMDQYGTRLRFTAPYAFRITGIANEWKTTFPEVKRVLQVLAAYDKKVPVVTV
jgi:transcription-repair coupling factor (superfamily II helicase)